MCINTPLSSGFGTESVKRSIFLKVNRNIVYYHGCAVEYFDHETGRAVIEFLERTGCKVEVLDLICCSFPLLNSGEISTAYKRAARLADNLVKYVDSGYEIVYSCPTCGYALKDAYPKLLNSESSRRVAKHTHFVSKYLLDLHGEGELKLQFKESTLRLAYHTPCHLRSQNLNTVSVELLSLIPGIKVQYIDRGCCGMGGTWALRSKYRNILSAEIGALLFKSITEASPSVVATDCIGCQIQIERYTGYRVIHPIRIIAEASK
jgi:glycerol-3-phosphate dehydrogenase subunit C